MVFEVESYTELKNLLHLRALHSTAVVGGGSASTPALEDGCYLFRAHLHGIWYLRDTLEGPGTVSNDSR